MTALRRLSPAFCALLLAAAVLGRALLPTGWMPQVDAGGVRIVLCTGDGPVVATLSDDGQIHRDGDSAPPRDPCPFALALGDGLDLPALPRIAAPPLPPAEQQVAALAAARLVAWRATRPPARGPPILA